MTIALYTGQPLTPGTIICRRVMVNFGIAGPPMTVVSTSPASVVARDRYGDETRVYLSTVAFVVSTVEEGMTVFTASMAHLNAERELLSIQTEASDERRRAVIEALLNPKESDHAR